MKKPSGFEHALSEYKSCDENLASGEPTAWGFELIAKLSEDQFARLAQFGDLEYSCGRWYLVTHRLTRDEAVQKYGPINAEIQCTGEPICSVTFGQTPFVSQMLCSGE